MDPKNLTLMAGASLAALGGASQAAMANPLSYVEREIAFVQTQERIFDHLSKINETRGPQIHHELQALMRPFIDTYFPHHAKMDEVDFQALNEAVLDKKDPAIDQAYHELVDKMIAVIDGKQPAPAANSKAVLTPADLTRPGILQNLEPSQVVVQVPKPVTVKLGERKAVVQRPEV